MLVQNPSSSSKKNFTIKPNQSAQRGANPPKNRANNRLYIDRHKHENPEALNNLDSVKQKHRYKSIPFWLTILLLTKNVSSLICYVTVGLALTMYGMTVYAPQQWTQKYNQLRELQKKERQFTFSDEVIKHQLALDANQPNSGLVNPDPTQPPIFLPETKVEKIEPVSENKPLPKKINRIYPIAY